MSITPAAAGGLPPSLATTPAGGTPAIAPEPEPGPSTAAGGDLPDPAARPQDMALPPGLPPHLASLAGALFVDGPAAADVAQGRVGDCFFMSALASLASARPDLVERMVTAAPDGTYSVRFYEGGDRAKPVDVRVDGQEWVGEDGAPLYGRGGPGELWPSIVEKAYAQWKGGYGALDQGAGADAGLRELTGAEVEYTREFPLFPIPKRLAGDKTLSMREFDDAVKAEMWDALRGYEAAKRPMVVGTADSLAQMPSLYRAPPGLRPGHAYSVLGTVEEDGKRYAILRNPWGNGEVGDDGKDDGIFRLDVETLARCTRGLAAAKVS